MPTLTIEGQRVTVGDEFLKLSPEEQADTVDEIAQSLGIGSGGGDRGHSGVPEYRPPGVEGYDPATGEVDRPGMGPLSTFGASIAEGVPIIGGLLDKGMKGISAGIGSAMTGDDPRSVYREMSQMVDRGRAENPKSRFAGNLTGGVVSMAPVAASGLGGQLLGVTGRSMATRTAASGLSNAAIGGADTLARGGSLNDAKRTAMLSGGIGAVLPGVGRAISQTGSKAAMAATPSVDQLRATGGKLYEKAFRAGVTVKPAAYETTLRKLGGDLTKFGFDAQLHPRTAAAIQRLGDAIGKPMSLQELDNLRRIAGQAARSPEASDREAASKVIEAIDDMVDNPANFGLRGGNAIGAPGTTASSPKAGLKALQEARATWHTMRKSETIDDLFQRAELTAGKASGPDFAKALQNEFRSLAKRKNGLRGFTNAEKSAIRKVSQNRMGRNAVVGLARYLRGIVGASLGGAAGFAGGGPLGAGMGAVAAGGLGYGLERAALGSAARSVMNSAHRASAAVRSGGKLRGNYPGNVASPLETALRPAPLLTHDRGRR